MVEAPTQVPEVLYEFIDELSNSYIKLRREHRQLEADYKELADFSKQEVLGKYDRPE